MTKNILTYTLAAVATLCPAQNNRQIETALFEVQYSVTYGHDRDCYCLRCGKTVSQYFSINNLRNDSLIASPDPSVKTIPLYESIEAMKNRNDPSKQLPSSPGHGDYLYWNLVPGKISVYTSIFGSNYLVEENIPTMDWKIEEDSVRHILGHECHKATARFRGREWKVWYAEDIPISLGPWKLNGLPGLIIQAECDGYISITASSLSVTGLSPVTFYNFAGYKYEPIERKKYWKAKNNPNSYPANTRIISPMELE